MLPLRYSRRWQIGGICLLAVVLVGTLLPAVGLWPGAVVSTLIGNDKLIHALMFLFLTLWYSGQYARPSYWRIAIGLIFFGGVIEVIQRSLTYRSGDMEDMLANLLGIAIGFAVALTGVGGWSERVEEWLDSRRARQG